VETSEMNDAIDDERHVIASIPRSSSFEMAARRVSSRLRSTSRSCA
jgi:hypothetical protein